jgi:hypothetical protein
MDYLLGSPIKFARLAPFKNESINSPVAGFIISYWFQTYWFHEYGVVYKTVIFDLYFRQNPTFLGFRCVFFDIRKGVARILP